MKCFVIGCITALWTLKLVQVSVQGQNVLVYTVSGHALILWLARAASDGLTCPCPANTIFFGMSAIKL